LTGIFDLLAHGADVLSDSFGRLDPRFAVVALAFQAGNLIFRAEAWRNVIAAAYSDRRVPRLGVGAAYVAGVALNGFLPARGGEAAKIALARLQVRNSSVVAIASASSVVLAFDALLGLILIAVAWATGALPASPHLPGTISSLTQWPVLIGAAVAAVIVGTAVPFVRKPVGTWLRRIVADARRGAAVWKSPRLYAKTVMSMQAGAWLTRIAAAYFLLAAFGLPASMRLALLVVVLGGLSALVPATPGGLGTQQVLLVYALHGTVKAGTALSFSIGMQLAVTITNTLVGITAAMIVFKTVRPMTALRAAGR
jgi:uncharacterized membrane protein YbhN (UPF0104 family)